MLVKNWSFCTVLCLALFLRIKAIPSFENNAYRGVSVSVSPRISPEDCSHLVESMQKILNEASSVLQTAIDARFGSVTFHLPQTCNSSAFPNLGFVSTYNNKEYAADIWTKDITDSAFGKRPVAHQYGGCGVPALGISIPNEFLTSEEEEGSYSKGKILAREWLKYRYGVFDENGFLEDPMYPTHYYIHGSDEIHITDCTSPKLGYSFRDSENNTCELTVETAANCSIKPNEEAVENVKSSLMFYHKELQQLDKICGKDEHAHNIGSLNKQNLICSYKSIWEVLQSHEDFKTSNDPSNDHAKAEIEYSFVQESELRLVVAWQDTISLFEKEKGATILKTVRKLLYDIPLGSKIGLYNFKGGEFNTLEAFTELTQAIRKSSTSSNFGSPKEGKPLVALEEAVKVLQANNEEDKPGKILIFTASDPEDSTELVEKLKNPKLCVNVVGFKGATQEGWNKFLNLSSCSSFSEIADSDDPAAMYEKLYSAVEPIIPPQIEDSKNNTISTKILSYNEDLEIPGNPRAKTFTVWIYHNVEFECLFNETAINITKEAESNFLVSYSFEALDGNVKCKMVDIVQGSYLVHVQMTTKEGEYFNNEVLFRDTTPADATEQMPYIIYAKIFYGEYPVMNADVRAEVTTPNGKKISLTLLDNGRGDPDVTKNDGIYSKYFVAFDGTGTYQVKITATDDKKANATRNGQDPCCGSVIVGYSFEVSEFIWTYETSFETTLEKPKTGYKPSRVTDLRVDAWNLPDSFTLKWTAPGEEMDEGKVKSYIIKSFTSPEDVFSNFDNDSYSIQVETKFAPKAFGEIETLEVKLYVFNDNETYLIALQSKRANELTSDTSNIVSIVIPVDKIDDKVTSQPPTKSAGLKPEMIALIVVLVLLAIVIVGVAVYFVVVRAKPNKKSSDSRSHSTSSQRPQTRPSGLNSIPADVILKHHNEVVSAKSLHKDPPIFDEEKIEMSQAESSNTSAESENNNRNYAVPSRTFQGEPKKSPKRMTVV